MSEIKYNVNVKEITTFGITAVAACVAYYDSIDELKQLLSDERLPRPFKHLGQGSNMLFTRDFPGTILISRIKELEFHRSGNDDVTVSVSAGYIMDDLCSDMTKLYIWGLENLSGIPGTAGASVVQNVGAYGVEAGELIESVDAIETETLNHRMFHHDEMQFGYRHSIFKTAAMRDRYIITRVRFHLTMIPKPRVDYANLRAIVGEEPFTKDMRYAVMAMRDSKLPNPSQIGSAGSFFKNPVIKAEHFRRIEASFPDEKVPHFVTEDGGIKVPAAWLIDKSGCKTMTQGGASLWQKQPLVIVNAVPVEGDAVNNSTLMLVGTATSDDIVKLEKRIIEAVSSRFDIILTPEVEHI